MNYPENSKPPVPNMSRQRGARRTVMLNRDKAAVVKKKVTFAEPIAVIIHGRKSWHKKN